MSGTCRCVGSGCSESLEGSLQGALAPAESEDGAEGKSEEGEVSGFEWVVVLVAVTGSVCLVACVIGAVAAWKNKSGGGSPADVLQALPRNNDTTLQNGTQLGALLTLPLLRETHRTHSMCAHR